MNFDIQSVAKEDGTCPLCVIDLPNPGTHGGALPGLSGARARRSAHRGTDRLEGAAMSATTVVMVPAERAEHIENIFEGLVGLGCKLAWAEDWIIDGIVLRRVFNKHSMEAQEYCLAAGVLVAEGWLSMVVVQGQIKGFIRDFPKTAAPPPPRNILQFPRRKCAKESTKAIPAAVVPLRRR